MRRGTHRNVVQAMLKNAAGEIGQSQIRHTIRKKKLLAVQLTGYLSAL